MRRIILGAKDRDLPVTIDMAYIRDLFEQQGGRCALSGLKLRIPDKVMDIYTGGECTASMDRINSILGYVPGNVQWVHRDVNRMKQDLQQDYFVSLCKTIASHS